MPSLSESLDLPFTFAERPAALPPDMRSVWRLGALVLLLDKCHGGAATIAQAHVLNWAIRSRDSRDSFLRVYFGEALLDDVVQRFDPTLDRAMDLAVGLGLAAWTPSARLRLTSLGNRFVGAIKESAVLGDEKAFLAIVQGKFSQSKLETMNRIV